MKTKILLAAAIALLAAPALAAEPPPPKEAPPAAADNQVRGARPQVYISMDFTDVDLPVLVKFMSEQTRRNFIFDERVTGKITIISPRKITVDEAYSVFLSVLQVKGFTVVEQGNAYKIVPAREARQESLATEKGAEIRLPSAEFVTRLIPLQYVDAAEVVALFAPLISKDGLLAPFPSSNTLLLIDTTANIDRILGILAAIDVQGTGATLRIYSLKYASATEVGRMLEQIFQDAAAAPQGGRPRTGRSVRSRGAGLRILPDPRTNAVIVLAGAELQADIDDLIRKVDIAAPENTGKINVYYLENADAEDIAKVLASLTEKKPAAAPAGAPGAAATVRGVISAELEGGVRITADKSTNSLIIIASMNDYLTILEVIKKLDIRRRQVYVEGLIVEISLDKGQDVGMEFRGAIKTSGSGAVLTGSNFDFQGNVNDFFKALAAGNPLLFSGTGLIAGGIAGNVVLPDGTKIPAVTAILRAAQNRTNLNVLSSPHLLTLDNKEAEIVVGENVPFITSQARDTTTPTLSNVINTIERKDVGVTLRITPHIHESDFVNLDIYQESSAVKGDTLLLSSTVGPTTTKRSAKTSVLVKNGDTVVLGGMMQETFNTVESKIPLLGDIPLLGWLFKFKSVTSNKTNLLIFLTPTVIKDPGAMAGKAAEQRKKMDRFIDQNKGEVERTIINPPPPEKK